jgi:hypothetical protein
MEISIKRPPTKKNQLLTIRLTSDEINSLNGLKKRLKFDSTRDLISFSLNIVDVLSKHTFSGYKLYMKNEKTKSTD